MEAALAERSKRRTFHTTHNTIASGIHSALNTSKPSSTMPNTMLGTFIEAAGRPGLSCPLWVD